MKVEDIERIFKETVSRPENSIHLPFEKHARVGKNIMGNTYTVASLYVNTHRNKYCSNCRK